MNIDTHAEQATHPLTELERLTFAATMAYEMGDDNAVLAATSKAEAIAQFCTRDEQRCHTYVALMRTQRFYRLKALIRKGGSWGQRWYLYELLLDSNDDCIDTWRRVLRLFFLGRYGTPGTPPDHPRIRRCYPTMPSRRGRASFLQKIALDFVMSKEYNE